MSEAEDKQIVAKLEELGHIGSALLDGEDLQKVIVDRAYWHIANKIPGHRFLSGDYFDVDHNRFLYWKKLLLRLETLADFQVNGAVWMQIKGKEDSLTVALQNGSIHRYYKFGEEIRDPEPEMQQAMDKDELVVAPAGHPSGTLTVIAPIRDSLGDRVGVLELSAMSNEAGMAPAFS